MARLNLSTTEARTRVKTYINQRYRKLQTSLGLGQVRRTVVNLNTVAGTEEYNPTNLIKAIAISYPAGNRMLKEVTLDQLRGMDPNEQQVGAPQYFAVVAFGATTTTLRIWPSPDAIYALVIDGLATGTNLVADGDVPVFPEDFHDYLVFAAAADELDKMEKAEASLRMEQRASGRADELRYFLAKSAYLGLQQSDTWWWGPWPGGYFGWGGWI